MRPESATYLVYAQKWELSEQRAYILSRWALPGEREREAPGGGGAGEKEEEGILADLCLLTDFNISHRIGEIVLKTDLIKNWCLSIFF